MKVMLTYMAVLIATVLSLPSDGGAAIVFKYVESSYDVEEIGLNQPEGIACANDYIVVADTGNKRLLRFSFDAEKMTADAVFKTPEIVHPVRAQISSSGDILVLDGKLLKIARLGPDGTFKGSLSFTGVSHPEEVVPRSFRVGGDDLIYVLDIFGSRVLVVDGAGNYRRHIPFPQSHGFFSDLIVNEKGDVLLLDSVKGVLYKAPGGAKEFTPLAENLKEQARFPANMTTDASGDILVVDRHGGSILLVGPDGGIQGTQLGFGWKEKLINYPSQICVGGEDKLFIADTCNSRIQFLEIAQ